MQIDVGLRDFHQSESSSEDLHELSGGLDRKQFFAIEGSRARWKVVLMTPSAMASHRGTGSRMRRTVKGAMDGSYGLMRNPARGRVRQVLTP